MIRDYLEFLVTVLQSDSLSKEKKLKELDEAEDILTRSLETIQIWRKRVKEGPDDDVPEYEDS